MVLGSLHPLLDAEDGGDLPLVVKYLGDGQHQIVLLGSLALEPVHLLGEGIRLEPVKALHKLRLPFLNVAENLLQ